MLSPFRTPAGQALLIQVAAAGLALPAALLLARSDAEPGLLAVAGLQALLAVLLAWLRGAERWWLLIHLLFSPGLVVLLALQLPSWIYLLLFVLMLGLYGQIFRTRVPYFPSSAAARDAVEGLLPAHALQFVDIGSGFGGLLIELARQRPDARFCGVELALLPWLCSCVRARLSGSRADFLRGDYNDLDLARFDVVYAYLSPAAMPALWEKASKEMRAGALLLSHEFMIPGVSPQFALPVGEGRTTLYGWRF